jgi:DNA-binding transcriptional ArsR family regulator
MVVKACANGTRCPTDFECAPNNCTQSLASSEFAWLTKAARLPGRSLHLAMGLVFLASVANSHQVALSNLTSQQFGLSRNAKYRALSWLEAAGLVRVERKLGRSPVVTLLSHGNGHDQRS